MPIYPGQMDPPLFEPKCTEPYYTRIVLPIEEWRHTEIPTADRPPANQAKVLRTLLHQHSITYRIMQIPRVDRPPLSC